MPKKPPGNLAPAKTIDDVVDEYRALSKKTFSEEDSRWYDQVLRFFRLSVNTHAHNKFEEVEKDFFWQFYVRGRGYSRTISSLFGPEKMPGEVKYFFRHFLGKHAYVSEEFERRAPGILKEFFGWLIEQGYLEAFEIDGVFPRNRPRPRVEDDELEPEWMLERAVELALSSLPPDAPEH